jgi:hypothetical protein
MENSLGPIVMLFMLGFMVLMIASVWKVFTKAGQPGWAAIIPFYNLYIMVKIAGKPGWWTLLIIFLPLIPIWARSHRSCFR